MHHNSSKQHTLWLLAALTAPLAHFSGCGWLTAAVTAAAILPLTLIPKSWEGMSKLLALAELLWLGAAAGILLQNSAVYWPSDNDWVVPLTLLTLADLKGKRVIDVGCGAGFPGVPVKIACPEMQLTLLDSLGKRMNWLQGFLPELGVEAECVTARAEEAIADRRETYDFATSRAVARLNILLELTAPYVKVGGAVLAMKGMAAKEELDEAKNAIRKLGLKLECVKEFPIEDTAHSVIVLRKVAPTPAQYPRRYAKIKQAPL